MKKLLLIISMVFGFFVAQSQTLKPDVIATAGNFYADSNNSMSWTIGECVPETFSYSSNKLTQGFHQGIYDINTEVDYTNNRLQIRLFPNPAIDLVTLQIQMQDKTGYLYQLLDAKGTCLKNKKIVTDNSVINLGDVVSGSYILNVFTTDNMLLKSFKILKIN